MAEDAKIIETINEIMKRMDTLINDMSVPKNVRTAVGEAKSKLGKPDGDYTVRVADAIYSIDGVSNDINLPPQARTVIWNILSMLESIKEQGQ